MSCYIANSDVSSIPDGVAKNVTGCVTPDVLFWITKLIATPFSSTNPVAIVNGSTSNVTILALGIQYPIAVTIESFILLLISWIWGSIWFFFSPESSKA